MHLSDQPLQGGAVQLLIDFLDAHHLNQSNIYAELLQKRGIKQITHREWWDYLSQIKELDVPDHVGLLIGQSIDPRHLGTFGYLLLSAPTLGAAVLDAQRYLPLLHQSDGIVIEPLNTQIRLRWTTHYGPSNQTSDEVYYSAILRIIQTCLGRKDITFDSIGFAFEEPAYSNEFQKIFRCPIQWALPNTEIIFQQSHLSLPVDQYNNDLHALLKREAVNHKGAITHDHEFICCVTQALEDGLQNGTFSATHVSRKLGMSRSTLHRRLSEQQLSFNVLLQRLRCEKAKIHLVNKKLQVTEIAYLLGYSDSSSFTRAYQEWTGETPTVYRAKRTS